MKNKFQGKHGPLLIAEIGGNHEGDFAYAKDLCQLAIESKVDFVKFQIYSGDKIVSKVENPKRNTHFKKFQLSNDQHLQLAQMVIDAGLRYTSSVWDLDSLSWIDGKIDIYKIGSGDLTAYPILKELTLKGKPIILSTGLSTEKEVLESVNFIQKQNPIYKSSAKLAILQCTSMYPIPLKEANLKVIPSLKEKTRLTVGYSDHTEGTKALKYATMIGADILEFHFTDDRKNKTFRDHKVSLVKTEVEELIKEIQIIQELKGSSKKRPTFSEKESGHLYSFRRAIYPNKLIKEGEKLTVENLVVLRPNKGIDSRQYFDILGATAKVDLPKFKSIDLKDIAL